MKIVTIIPARIASTRLTQKPLIMIGDKPMVIATAEQAKKADIGPVYIACDDPKITEVCEQYNYNFIITRPEIATGSDRVYEAFKSLQEDFDWILNLQGDMPQIKPQTIQDLANATILNSNFDILTGITSFKNKEEQEDLSNVSAIVAHEKREKLSFGDLVQALYFTRTPNPYPISLYKHLGLYLYKKSALETFVKLPQSRLEVEEKLEQLRALENGLKISCLFVDDQVISVDTERDLKALFASNAKKDF
jgi:3-deoxy-manno-octulosonate cytidylyltransferase (CMP-KDO synthetase)